MRNLILIVFSVILISFCFEEEINAQTKTYTEGSVWTISFVKTKLPHFNNYMADLSNGWKKVMDEAKKEGLVLDYMILSSAPSNPEDWNLMLMVEHKNLGALDGLNDKMDKIAERLFGGEETRQKSAVSRNELREMFGNKVTRQLLFK